MSHFELINFDGAAALATEAADQLLRFISERRKKTILCLSGGRITVTLFQEIRRRCKENAGMREFIEGVEFFWADERCVPPSDPESN